MVSAMNACCLHDHLGAERRHDVESTLATLHPDCHFDDQPLGWQLNGRDGARQHYELWWSAFHADLEAGTLRWLTDDLAIGEAAVIGRHVGSFAGLAPTGRGVRVPFVVFVEFRDGLLSGERFVYDLNGVLAQLGQPVFHPQPPSAIGTSLDHSER
jgi:steroid delta-isomerase-like uncharacterized protein